jgi:hypothetical protein
MITEVILMKQDKILKSITYDALDLKIKMIFKPIRNRSFEVCAHLINLIEGGKFAGTAVTKYILSYL